MDALRVYLIYDPAFDAGEEFYSLLMTAFDSVGMQREGLRFSVPVHRRSVPWGATQDACPATCPRRIDLAAAKRNLVLIALDPVFADRLHVWRPFVDDLRYRADERTAEAGQPMDLIVPVLVDGTNPVFERLTQSIRVSSTDLLDEQPSRAGRRLVIQLLNALLVHRDPTGQRDASGAGHVIFVSHAKHDGVEIARQIVRLLGDVNQKLGPRCFFDADSLIAGDNYRKRFEESIDRASLLSVVTTAYHTRPWCRWEVLLAKRHGRPVVAADLTDARIERTFPYLGNVPTIRVQAAAADNRTLPEQEVERLTLALLSEALRAALWRDRADMTSEAASAHLCIRPPELSDVALVAAQARPNSSRVLYPDPPLSTEELDLLREAFPDVDVRTLGQVSV